jgi:hypothetical protein
MLPIPTMSTETLASCAEARQSGAPKMIDANRDRFIMHQIIPAPLARTLNIGYRVNPPLGLSIEERRNDARASSAARSRVRSTWNLYSITAN